MTDFCEMREAIEHGNKDATIPGRCHYTLLSGSLVRVDLFDADGNEIGYETHMLRENVCIYIEGQDEIPTTRGLRINKK